MLPLPSWPRADSGVGRTSRKAPESHAACSPCASVSPSAERGGRAPSGGCSEHGCSVWQPRGKGTSQALSWESRCLSVHGARSLSPALIPALPSLSLNVDPAQTAAFPGALAVCARHDIALLCGLPSALQMGLFLPLNRYLACKSLPARCASTRPHLCSAQRRSALVLPCIAHHLLWGFFPVTGWHWDLHHLV